MLCFKLKVSKVPTQHVKMQLNMSKCKLNMSKCKLNMSKVQRSCKLKASKVQRSYLEYHKKIIAHNLII